MSTIPASLPISTAQTTAESSAVKPPNNELDKDAFLQLLVAQLKYQDPLEPTNAQDFMAQTAQFTQVETLTKISDQNEAAIRSQNMNTGSSLIGRTITFRGLDGSASTGVVSAAQLTADGVILKVGNSNTTLDRVTEISQGNLSSGGGT